MPLAAGLRPLPGLSPNRLALNGMLPSAGGGAGPPLTSLVQWWKADSLGLADGDLVPSWPSSVSGTTLTATPGGFSATFKTAILNGLPIVRFDGARAQAGFTIAAPFTAIAVYASSNVTLNQRTLGDNGAGNWLLGPRASLHQIYAGGFVSTPVAAVNNVFVVHTATQDAGTVTGYVNGTQYGTSATPTGAPGELAGQNGAGEPLVGDIAEVLIYSVVLSGANRSAAETYLRTKWGI